MTQIDLNADLGEGFGMWRLSDDEALLDVITSANVACGFHAGDPTIMRGVCESAAERGIAIGAQVSYRDLAGFGRRAIDMDPAELTDEVIYQIAALDGFARIAGIRVAYVKPHGALYNRIVHDIDQAAAVVAAVASYNSELPVLGLPDSEFLRLAAEAGLTTVCEGFADRAYTAAGTLVPRRHAHAVLNDPSVVAARAVAMATQGKITAHDGTVLPTEVHSICVHGDTPRAVDIARQVREALDAAGVTVTSFTMFDGLRG